MSNLNMQVKALIVQRILPHYRLAFFQQLSMSDILFDFAYGQSNPYSALESIINPSGIQRYLLKNIYFGKHERAVIQKGILKLIKKKKYTVIIAESNPRIISSIILLIYAKIIGIKFIWWGHGLSNNSDWFSIKLRVLLAHLADAFIFYDDSRREYFIRLGVDGQKLFTAPNSTDCSTKAALKKVFNRQQRYRIIYIGRLIKDKKVELLIDAFSISYQRLPSETILTLIGDGPLLSKLEEKVNNLHLQDKIIFTGAIYDQNILADYFNDAWVCVSPGYIGLSIIDSFSFGVPMIISNREPHRPEIQIAKEGNNSIFFDTDDPCDLGKKLLEFAYYDEEKWATFSSNTSDAVDQSYGLRQMQSAFENAINYTLMNE